MKWFPLCFSIFLVTPVLADPIGENPLLRQLEGSWTGAGQLTDAEGNVTDVAETWTASFPSPGSFVMKGSRDWNMQQFDFSWEFYASGEIVEGIMITEQFPDLKPRFEAQFSEKDRSITLQIPLNQAMLTIVNTLSEDGKSLQGTVRLVDDTGRETLTGEMEHRKE